MKNGKNKLKLEWVEAGTLDENPMNWRRHSENQMDTIKDLISDPDVGWAGVLLYNRKTKRLIDGHGRKKAVAPDTLVPVLSGEWTEDGERKILASLDPIAAMAEGDKDMYRDLADSINAETLELRDLLDTVHAELEAIQEDADGGDAEPTKDPHPDMELRPWEHYDYLLVLATNTTDWEALCELFGIKKVNCSPLKGKVKTGLGRAVNASRVLSLINELKNEISELQKNRKRKNAAK